MKRNDFVFLVAIANQENKQILLEEISSIGGVFFECLNGYGSMRKKDILHDFDVEQSKVIITCIIKEEKSIRAIEALVEKHRFNEPNTGIAFTIPIEGVQL